MGSCLLSSTLAAVEVVTSPLRTAIRVAKSSQVGRPEGADAPAPSTTVRWVSPVSAAKLSMTFRSMSGALTISRYRWPQTYRTTTPTAEALEDLGNSFTVRLALICRTPEALLPLAQRHVRETAGA